MTQGICVFIDHEIMKPNKWDESTGEPFSWIVDGISHTLEIEINE